MSAPKPRVTQVVIKAPKTVTDLLALAKNVVTALTGNPYVPAPNPPLPVVKTQISDLESSQSLALTKVKGAAETRNIKERALLNTLHILKASVQPAANADPANATTIINSAGLSVQAARAPHPKASLAAKDGITSGSVKLVTPSRRPATAPRTTGSTARTRRPGPQCRRPSRRTRSSTACRSESPSTSGIAP